jgi:hypothetical protein
MKATIGPGVAIVLAAAGQGASALAQSATFDPVHISLMLVSGIERLYEDKKMNNKKCRLMKDTVKELSAILTAITPEVQEVLRRQLHNVYVALTGASNWFGAYSKKGAFMKTLTSKEEADKYTLAKEALDSAVSALHLAIGVRRLEKTRAPMLPPSPPRGTRDPFDLRARS